MFRLAPFFAALLLFLACPAHSGAAGFTVEESVGAGDYVVLVHGVDWFRDTLKPTADFLNREGYCTINVRYPSRKITCTEEAVDWVDKVVTERCTDPARKIHLIGHSMGTAVVREYLTERRPARLGRVVLLAAPNRGTPLASPLRWKPLGKMICPAAAALGCGKKGAPLAEPAAVDFAPGVLMGNRPGWLPFFSPFLPGADDGVVPVSSGALPGMAELRVLPTSHTAMPRNGEVLSETLSFLRTGRFVADRLN